MKYQLVGKTFKRQKVEGLESPKISNNMKNDQEKITKDVEH